MSKDSRQPAPDLESASKKVRQYFDENTPGIYLRGWNLDHIHFGLFEPGECPAPGELMVESESVARALQRMVKVIVEPAKIQAHHHVVDAGCGVGGTSVYLAKNRGCRVTGVNIHEPQLEIARAKASEALLTDRVWFEYADCAQSLPFEDNSIDVVVNIESACHYGDRARFLHEVSRILKPGGILAASDWMARDGLDTETYDRDIMPLCEPYAVRGLESRTTYKEKLNAAGLEILEFAGFDGKDADNVEVMKNVYHLLTSLRLSGINSPEIIKLTDQFRTLYEAWSRGSFVLERYCATKPD